MSQQINLFNPIFMKQKKYFSLLAMAQALALIVLGALLFYAYAWYQVGQMDKQYQLNARQFEADQARFAALTSEFSPQQSNQALQDQISQLEAKLGDEMVVVEMLKSGVIGNTSGYSQYMSAFARQVVSGLWLTGFKVSGDATQITLEGAVTDGKLLPDYIQRLSKEASMQGKSFSNLQMQQVAPDKDSKLPHAARYVTFTLQADAEVKK